MAVPFFGPGPVNLQGNQYTVYGIAPRVWPVS